MKMPKVDVPGLEKARALLAQMTANPKSNTRLGVVRALIEELYPEIRSARLAGHTFDEIREMLVETCGIQFTSGTLARNFGTVDREWESRTGVKALPGIRYEKAKKRRAA